MRRHASEQRNGIGTAEDGLSREGRPRFSSEHQTRERVAPSPFFDSPSQGVTGPKPRKGRAGGAREGNHDVCENRETVAEARLERGRCGPAPGDPDERIVRNLATAPWPYGLADAEAFLARERDPREASSLIFMRTLGRRG